MLKHFLRKKVVQDLLSYGTANAIIQVCGLLGVLIVSRYLGPTNLGLYSFVQNYIAAFVTIISGVDIYVNWNSVRQGDYYPQFIKYTKMKVEMVTVLALFLTVSSFFFLPHDIFFLTLFLIIPLFTSSFSSYVFILQYQNKTKLITLATSFSAVLLLTLKVCAVFFKAPLWVFIAINSLDGLLLIILSIYYVRHRNSSQSLAIAMRDFVTLFRSSFFAITYVVSWFVFVRVDQFFVPYFFDARSLGVYSAAVKIVEMSNVLVVIMQSVIVPRVLLLQDVKTDKKRTHFSLGIYLGLGILSSLFISSFSELIAHILYGYKFIETGTILRVYAWSIPGLFVSYFFGVIAMSKRSFKVLAFSSVSLATVSVLLCFLAAKTGSLTLVAAMSVLLYSLAGVFYYGLWRKGIL